MYHRICRPGRCGTGIGPDTWTSGFEGHWTFTPTEWNNEYFRNLLYYNWTSIAAPGFNRTVMGDPFGTALQWIPANVTFNASDFNASLFMFTSDLAVSVFFILLSTIL
jgi:catalase-peroxidase